MTNSNQCAKEMIEHMVRHTMSSDRVYYAIFFHHAMKRRRPYDGHCGQYIL
jgi:hypothetical protein